MDDARVAAFVDAFIESRNRARVRSRASLRGRRRADMSKRHRANDDGAASRSSDDDDDDAVTIGYRRAPTNDRDALCAAHVEALNAQFARHVAKKTRDAPREFLVQACRDYVTYANAIRKEFRDAAGAGAAADEAKRGEASASGEAYVWGQGDSAQLGLGGDVDERRRPTRVTTGAMGEARATRIAAGGTHTLALTSDGACYSWGNNDNGALGRVVNKDADPDAEYAPGKVELPLDVKVVMVSTGDSHGCALTESGEVWAWGQFRTTNGAWAFNPNTLDAQKTSFPFKIYAPASSKERAKAIVSGVDHVLALSREGGVYSWGCSEKGRLGRVDASEAEDNEQASDDVKRRLLTPSRVALPKSGGGIGSAFGGEPEVTAIVAGDFHSFAICADEDGSKSDVYGWGLSNFHQVGLWDPNPDLRGDEQVTYFPKRVASLCGKRIVAGDAGAHHSLFLTGDGKIIAIGRYTDGRCGVRVPNAALDGALEEPRVIEDLPGRAVKVASGDTCGGAIMEDGSAYVWGSQYIGQLGLGPREEDAYTPEKMPYTKPMAGKVFAELSFGGQHAAALLIDAKDDKPASKRARGA